MTRSVTLSTFAEPVLSDSEVLSINSAKGLGREIPRFAQLGWASLGMTASRHFSLSFLLFHFSLLI